MAKTFLWHRRQNMPLCYQDPGVLTSNFNNSNFNNSNFNNSNFNNSNNSNKRNNRPSKILPMRIDFTKTSFVRICRVLLLLSLTC